MKKELMAAIREEKTHSAWYKGVKLYALELLENQPEKEMYTEEDLLDGAVDWMEYSYNGLTLISDLEIAKRLCTPYGLKKTDGGRKEPNPQENWLDVQGRALTCAWYMIWKNQFYLMHRGSSHE